MFAALSMASAASICATSPLVSINPMASFIMIRAVSKMTVSEVKFRGVFSRGAPPARVETRTARCGSTVLADSRRAFAPLRKHRREFFVRTRNDLHADDLADLAGGAGAGVDG